MTTKTIKRVDGKEYRNICTGSAYIQELPNGTFGCHGAYKPTPGSIRFHWFGNTDETTAIAFLENYAFGDYGRFGSLVAIAEKVN